MSSSSSSILATSTTRQPINPYGYVPTEWICIMFLVLFSVSTAIHVGQTAHSRLWWLIPTAVTAGIGEILGWSARLWSSQNAFLITPYLMQISTTIIAPTPLIAANFIILGQIMHRMGQAYSRLSAKMYTTIFLTCDIIALIIQAIGGARASIAVKNGNNPKPGGNIMLAGVAFQLVALVVYVSLAAEFVLRYAYDQPFKRAGHTHAHREPVERRTKLMLMGLGVESIFLLIRSIYRLIELSDGWRGVIITTQVYFNVLDGAMIVLAMYTLNFFHPGRLIGRADAWLNSSSQATRTKVTEKDGV